MNMKRPKTPIAELGDVCLRVRGWNEPHVFVSGVRHALTKQDAHTMSRRWGTQYFKQRHDIELRMVRSMPLKRGEYHIFQFPEALFEVRFCDGQHVCIFMMQLSPACTGVIVRESLEIIDAYLTHGPGCLEPLPEEMLVSFEMENVENVRSEIQSEEQERVLDARAMAELRTEFPKWFQKKHRKNLSWEGMGTSQMSSAVLVCPCVDGVRRFNGIGITKQVARDKALVAAAVALGYLS